MPPEEASLNLEAPEDMSLFSLPIGTAPLARFVLAQEVGF
jgi:hypothetical protein